MGPIGVPNPDSGLDVDVDFGEEYITDLNFSIADLSLAGPQVVVPLPASLMLYSGAIAVLLTWRKLLI